MVTINKFADF